jgi:hypothetical protein
MTDLFSWENTRAVLDYAGYAATIVLVLGFLYAVYLWARGIAPALIRLGNGLSRRKIAIFAKSNTADSLHSLLKDSNLFRHTNLISIRDEGDIGKAEPASVFLVHWPDWTGAIDGILAQKRDKTALILYAPPGHHVPPDVMAKVNMVRNATLVNLRGRLMNDIVLSMITTSYDKN